MASVQGNDGRDVPAEVTWSKPRKAACSWQGRSARRNGCGGNSNAPLKKVAFWPRGGISSTRGVAGGLMRINFSYSSQIPSREGIHSFGGNVERIDQRRCVKTWAGEAPAHLLWAVIQTYSAARGDATLFNGTVSAIRVSMRFLIRRGWCEFHRSARLAHQDLHGGDQHFVAM